MTTPEQNVNPEQETVEEELPPIIPPWVLLAVAGLGLLAVVAVLFLAPTFNIFGWAGLATTVIALVIWALMFPEEVVKLLKGRGLAFGGLGIGVTIFVIVAASLVYNVISAQGWSRDLSERDIYSLDNQVSDVLVAMGEDPSIPTVQLLGFFPLARAAERDRVEVLLQDMVNTSGGKIAGYEFIDPSLEPQRTENYLGENPRLPAIVVAAIDPATGLASTDDFEISLATGQFQIINAMLSLSVEGDFRAYFLTLEGALETDDASDDGASGIIDDLSGEWDVDDIDPLRLASGNSSVVLNDPTASAEIMIIAGGTQTLSDDELNVLREYVTTGGDLIILGDINTDGGTTTAQAENFSTFLWETFGVRFRNDLVIDPTESISDNGRLYLLNNYGTHPTTTGLESDEFIVVNSPHSVEVSDTPPANVTVTVLLSTTDAGYAKADVDYTRDLSLDELAFVDGTDLAGEIPVAVAAENTATGARLVLFGGTDLMRNEWRQFGNIEAPEFAESMVLWASEAQNFSEVVRQLVPEANVQDTPVVILESQTRWMGFVSLFLLPFGMLGIGLLVWWLRRSNRVTS